MYFTSGSDRAFESLMQGKPGFDHYDSGDAGAPEDCGDCRFYRPDWKYQFCVYAECPYQPGKLTAYDAVLAKGHVWICKVKDEFQARELEKMYHVSAKQYVDGGLQMKILCETQPDVPCIPCEITLEDAYIYISNNAKTK